MGNLTTQQIENIVFGAGVVYKNYGEVDELILAPCKGGSKFKVEQEIKEIEYDGRKGKTKGLRPIVSENATLTVNLMGLSQDNLSLAIAGSVAEGGFQSASLMEYVGVGVTDEPEVFTLSQTPINNDCVKFFVDGVEQESWVYGTEWTRVTDTITVAEDFLTDGEKVVVQYAYDTAVENEAIIGGQITAEHFLKNITLIAPNLAGKSKVVTIYNALGDNGLEWSLVDKEEGVIVIEFSANYDPTDLTEPIWKIDEVA